MAAQLSKPMFEQLKRLSGDKTALAPATRWAQERTNWALINRGLINPVGWTLTDAGRAALKQEE